MQSLKGGPTVVQTNRTRAARPGDVPSWLVALVALGMLQAALGVGSLLAPATTASNDLIGMLLATSAAFMAAAVYLVHGAAADRRALWLGAFFVSIGAAPAMPALGWLTHAGWPVSWIRALLPEAFLPTFLFAFVREFPRIVHRSPSSRLLRAGFRVSVVVSAVLFASNAALRSVPALVADTPVALAARNGRLYWPLVLGLTLLALAAAVVRMTEAVGDERRRAAFLLGSLVAGCAPGFSLIVLEYLVPAVDRFARHPLGRFYSDLVLYLPLLAIPPLAVHAVRGHRVLSVRATLHAALKHTLAGRIGRALILAGLAVLALHGALYRSLPLEELLVRQPAPALMAAVALGAVVLLLRPIVLGALEPAWRAEARQRALGEFTRDVASARSSREVIDLLVEHTRRALGVEGCVVLLREGAGEGFIPAGGGGRRLAADSALIALTATGPEPLPVDPLEPATLFAWLPPSDQEWVVDCDVALLVPLGGTAGHTIGLVGLPPRVSGAPYDSQDHTLTAMLGSAAALALRRFETASSPIARAATDDPATECTACGRVERVEVDRCECGGALVPCVIPIEINGRFRVESVLGHGGMGVVYRGRDLELDRPVALKTLPRAGSEALLRLRREARSMARFIHPHLALIFGTESWRGVPVLIVEYLAGGTLAGRLGRPLPVRDVLEWGMGLASALDAMHAQGLLHRDVKPSNIGFAENGTVKLLDFGLARLSDEIRDVVPPDGRDAEGAGDAVTQANHLVGTPRYLSPEAMAGHDPAPAQDVWALFVVMWEAIAGAHPFGDGAPHLRSSRLADVRPDCPSEVAELLHHGLHRRRERRIQTAADALSHIVRALGRLSRAEPPVRTGLDGR